MRARRTPTHEPVPKPKRPQPRRQSFPLGTIPAQGGLTLTACGPFLVIVYEMRNRSPVSAFIVRGIAGFGRNPRHHPRRNGERSWPMPASVLWLPTLRSCSGPRHVPSGSHSSIRAQRLMGNASIPPHPGARAARVRHMAAECRPSGSKPPRGVRPAGPPRAPRRAGSRGRRGRLISLCALGRSCYVARASRPRTAASCRPPRPPTPARPPPSDP